MYQNVKTNNAMKKLHQLMGKTVESTMGKTASNKTAESDSHIIIIILMLNVHGLNAPIKRHRLANWIKSQDPLVSCIQETHLMCKDTHRLKIKDWKKIYQANGEQNKAGVAILVSDKIDFKPTKIKRDKKGHYIMVKGSMHQEELRILNIYTPNIGVHKKSS